MGQKISEMTDVVAGALATDEMELARSSSSTSFRIALSALATFIRAVAGPLAGTTLNLTGILTTTARIDTAADVKWTNNTGFGLVGSDGVRFLSYTTAGGVVIGSGAASVNVLAALAVQGLTATGVIALDAAGAAFVAVRRTAAPGIDFQTSAAVSECLFGNGASISGVAGSYEVYARAGFGFKIYTNATLAITVATNQTVTFAAGITGPSATLSAGNALFFSATQSRIIPGTTNLGFNNNANTFTNLMITDAGDVTIRATATATSYRVGANQVIGARVTGYTAMTGSPDKATAYATGTVTLAQLAGRVAQLQADLTTHGVIGA